MKCELCKVRARIFCESDQASLCWTCDTNVHSANFLVARHSRTLLCRTCDSLTPWKATGASLAKAVSVCDRCANGDERQERQEQHGESEGGNNVFEMVTKEEDGDNQVVPLSPSAPPPSSYSGSEESVNGYGDCSELAVAATTLKRRREGDDSDRDEFQGDSSGSRRRDGGEWSEEVGGTKRKPPLKGWLDR